MPENHSPANGVSNGEADDFIFSYFNGVKTIHADPVDLHYRLLEVAKGHLAQVWDESKRRGPDDEDGDSPEVKANKEAMRAAEFLRAIPALRQLTEWTREAFRMVPYDEDTGKGATIRHCSEALDDFFIFLASEKKSTDDSPTDAPSSESTAP